MFAFSDPSRHKVCITWSVPSSWGKRGDPPKAAVYFGAHLGADMHHTDQAIGGSGPAGTEKAERPGKLECPAFFSGSED